MERTLDETYYESALISFLMKIGIISEPKVNHSDPTLFGLTREEAVKIRLRHLKGEKTLISQDLSDIKAQYLRGEQPEAYISINSLQEKIDKIDRNIHFLKARLKGDTTHQEFDLERLKQIPMNSITEILPNGFFRNNPFRQEKSPSNSLFYYKKDNRCQDFATGKSYDSIDLFMAVNNCDFKTACKELSSL